jgi:hypothetical protein
MSNFVSAVRFVAKAGQRDLLIQRLSDFTLPTGALNHLIVQTGGDSFMTVVMWREEQDLVNARPSMIAFLDTVRDLLEQISPDLGVTDPVSGPVLLNIQA